MLQTSIESAHVIAAGALGLEITQISFDPRDVHPVFLVSLEQT